MEREMEMAKKTRFGELFKRLRLDTGATLREFCLKNSLDPGNLSRLERGVVPPPQNHDKLEEYAKFLGLKKGSDDWYQFFDLAAAESGKFPKDVLSDDQVVAKLPVLFRTLRGQKVTDEELDQLVRQIQGK